MRIYNTLHRKKEAFTPLIEGKVGMYHCGPTVYFSPHIGNWRAFVFDDMLRRAFTYLGYDVYQVMNITDVGHLTSDEDTGEDKLEKGARRENKTVWEVADFYTNDFLEGRDAMHILPPTILARATEHIPEQIKLIDLLIKKEYAYVTPEAVYYAVDKFPTYINLSRQKLDEKEIGVREEVVVDVHKRKPYDFRLWQLDRPDHQMQWDSPWGRGFPGWHIECSAMSMEYLGDTFDIHTGGVDHIPVHHPNEIAQSDGAVGHAVVRYWMHNEFLTVEGGKMGKSLGNAYTLQEVEAMLHNALGFSSANFPMALRYLYAGAHYRTKMDFSLQGLIGAFTALTNVYETFALLYHMHQDTFDPLFRVQNAYIENLIVALEDDLDTPAVLALFNTLMHDESMDQLEKMSTMLTYDEVLGLGVLENTRTYIFTYSKNVQEMIGKRNKARLQKDFALSDALRDTLYTYGIDVMDKGSESIYFRK